MNCRVCNQPLDWLVSYNDMPARAQFLHDTPDEDSTILKICQCSGCGLVQLDVEPVHYWQTPIRAVERRIYGMDFVSCNYLEHIPNPNEYLRQFQGTGAIEVPNFDFIKENGLFQEFMVDHLMYFTEDTLRFTLQYNGFKVLSMETVMHDYVIRAYTVRRKHLDMTPFYDIEARLKKELDDFISRYEAVVIYGASHQAFAIIALCKPDITFVIDDAKFKQGKYTPVGGIPIVDRSFLEGADAVVVIGGGYCDDILKNLDFDGGVAVVRPHGLEVLR